MQLITVEALHVALSKLLGWAGIIAAQQQASEKEARKTVLEALKATQVYIGRLTRGESEDYSIQESLANKWMEAAGALDAANNKAFAEICYKKADYWAGAETWTKAELESTDLSLKKVISELQDMS